MPIRIRPARTPSDLHVAKTLILSYAAALGVDLAFQDFAAEIADLGSKYGPPGGEILLAIDGDDDDDDEEEEEEESARSTPATTSGSRSRSSSGSEDEHEDEDIPSRVLGCVALRPLPSTPTYRVCELKRLYVTPRARNRGVGKALMVAAMELARERGYGEMRLDTRKDMHGPMRMYKGLGFGEIGAYYEIERGIREGMVFFGRRL